MSVIHVKFSPLSGGEAGVDVHLGGEGGGGGGGRLPVERGTSSIGHSNHCYHSCYPFS